MCKVVRGKNEVFYELRILRRMEDDFLCIQCGVRKSEQTKYNDNRKAFNSRYKYGVVIPLNVPLNLFPSYEANKDETNLK